MIVTLCYFLKSVKSVFVLVPCNTSLSKNYVAHSYVTVVCLIGCIWEKSWFVCTRWLSVHTKSVIEQGFFHEFAFDNKALKTFLEFWIWWKRSKFERRQIRIRTSSHPYITPNILNDRWPVVSKLHADIVKTVDSAWCWLICMTWPSCRW